MIKVHMNKSDFVTTFLKGAGDDAFIILGSPIQAESEGNTQLGLMYALSSLPDATLVPEGIEHREGTVLFTDIVAVGSRVTGFIVTPNYGSDAFAQTAESEPEHQLTIH